MESEKGSFRPKFYAMLTTEDQQRYDELRRNLSSRAVRNRRGKRLATFTDIISTVKTFCVRGDADDWKRCLVCGICWLTHGIGINNRQLSILLDKCKSSINGSLHKMGYTTLQSHGDSNDAMKDAIPLLSNNFSELREWTVRLFVAVTPQPNLPLYAVNVMPPFQSPMPNQYSNFGIFGQLPPSAPLVRAHEVVKPEIPIIPDLSPVTEPLLPVSSDSVSPFNAAVDFFGDDGFCLPPDFLMNDDVPERNNDDVDNKDDLTPLGNWN